MAGHEDTRSQTDAARWMAGKGEGDGARSLAAACEAWLEHRAPLPSHVFYDTRGMQLFEELAAQPSYYPREGELRLLRQAAGSVAEALRDALGPSEEVVLAEFGCSNADKVAPLLESLEGPKAFVPIDVCGSALREASAELQTRFAAVPVRPLQADFTKLEPGELQALFPEAAMVGAFLGPTISAFPNDEAVTCLRSLARAVGSRGAIVVTFDTKKGEEVVHRAYNDPEGRVGAFIRNALFVLNRELGADFDPSRFTYEGRYDPESGIVRCMLVSKATHEVHVAGRNFTIPEGAAYFTKPSCKFSEGEFVALVGKAGLTPIKTYISEDGLVGLVVAVVGRPEAPHQSV